MKFIGILGGGQEDRAELTRILLGKLKSHSLNVSVIADAGATAEVDIPGKDSHEHRRAGAREVLAVSRLRWALVHEVPPAKIDARPPLDQLLARLVSADVVLAPGIAEENGITLDIAPDGNTLRAFPQSGKAVTFHLDSSEQIAEFIINAAAEKNPTQ